MFGIAGSRASQGQPHRRIKMKTELVKSLERDMDQPKGYIRFVVMAITFGAMIAYHI